MTLNKISAGQISTPTGPFFATADVPAGQAFRHPGRGFVGAGYQHNQRTDGSVTGGSWLQSFPTAGQVSPVVEWDYVEDMAKWSVVAEFGLAISGAVQTLNGGGLDGQSVNGFALNNRVGNQKAWGGYFDGVRAVAGAGTTVGIEVDATNLPGVSPRGGATPYNAFVDGQTVVLAAAAGSGNTTFGRSYAVDAFLEIRDNGAPAYAGINFRFDAILREGVADNRTAVGNVGYAKALSLATQQGFSWYSRDPVGAPGSGTQAEVLRLTSSINSPTSLQSLTFSDAGMYYNSRMPGGLDIDADPMFCVDLVAGADNYIAAVASGPAATPGFEARGDAVSVDLMLTPKGPDGLLRFNTTIGVPASPVAFSANRYLRIKGGGGTIYYLPLMTTGW